MQLSTRTAVNHYPLQARAIARTFAAVDVVPAKYYVEAWDASRRVWPFDAAVEDSFKRFPHLWMALLLSTKVRDPRGVAWLLLILQLQSFADFLPHSLPVLCSLCASFVAAAILIAKVPNTDTAFQF